MTKETTAGSYEKEFAPELTKRLCNENFKELKDALTKLTVGLAVLTKEPEKGDFNECSDLLKEAALNLVSERINSYLDDLTADSRLSTMEEGRLHANITMIKESVTKEIISIADECTKSGNLNSEQSDEFSLKFRIFLTEYMFLAQLKLDWILMKNCEAAGAFCATVTGGYRLPKDIAAALEKAAGATLENTRGQEDLADTIPPLMFKEISSILNGNDDIGSLFGTRFYAILSSVKNVFYSGMFAIIENRNRILKNISAEEKEKTEKDFEKFSNEYAHLADIMFSNILDYLVKAAIDNMCEDSDE